MDFVDSAMRFDSLSLDKFAISTFSSGTEVAMCVSVSCSAVSDSLQSHGLQPTRLLCPWISPGKNTGVSFHALLQGIFPTQG